MISLFFYGRSTRIVRHDYVFDNGFPLLSVGHCFLNSPIHSVFRSNLNVQFAIQLNDTLVADLDCADDICFFEDYQGKAEELLDRVTICDAKTSLLIKANNPKTLNSNYSKKLTNSGEGVENVQNFSYLRSTVTIDHDITPEICSRIGRATTSRENSNKI